MYASIADSLRHVIALKQALLEAAATRSVVVNVPPAHVTVSQVRDRYDWIALVATLLVTSAVALLAARLGAKLGGSESRKAALAVHEKQVEAERDDQKRRVWKRLERGLRRIMAAADAIGAAEPTSPFSVAMLDDLVQIWAGYDRVSDDLVLIGTSELQDRIDEFFSKIRMAAETIADGEGRFEQRRLLAQGDFAQSFLAGAGALEARKHVKASATTWRQQAEALWRELQPYAPKEGTGALPAGPSGGRKG